MQSVNYVADAVAAWRALPPHASFEAIAAAQQLSCAAVTAMECDVPIAEDYWPSAFVAQLLQLAQAEEEATELQMVSVVEEEACGEVPF